MMKNLILAMIACCYCPASKMQIHLGDGYIPVDNACSLFNLLLRPNSASRIGSTRSSIGPVSPRDVSPPLSEADDTKPRQIASLLNTCTRDHSAANIVGSAQYFQIIIDPLLVTTLYCNKIAAQDKLSTENSAQELKTLMEKCAVLNDKIQQFMQSHHIVPSWLCMRLGRKDDLTLSIIVYGIAMDASHITNPLHKLQKKDFTFVGDDLTLYSI